MLKNSFCQTAFKNRPNQTRRETGRRMARYGLASDPLQLKWLGLASDPLQLKWLGLASDPRPTATLGGASQHHARQKSSRSRGGPSHAKSAVWHANEDLTHVAVACTISVRSRRDCGWPMQPQRTPPSRWSSLRSYEPLLCSISAIAVGEKDDRNIDRAFLAARTDESVQALTPARTIAIRQYSEYIVLLVVMAIRQYSEYIVWPLHIIILIINI